MIDFKHKGAFEKTKRFLKEAQNIRALKTRAKIETLAAAGVSSLQTATPKRTGATAAAWAYEIEESDGQITVTWTNDNIVNGLNIAIILQYGHATKNGGRVAGIDYINPALQTVFKNMADNMWKAVVSL